MQKDLSLDYKFHVTISNQMQSLSIYCYHLWKLSSNSNDPTVVASFLSTRYNDKIVDVFLGARTGKITFPYKCIELNVTLDTSFELIESDDFKGTGAGSLSKWHEVWITINAPTRMVAENAFQILVNETSRFTKKKEEHKVSVQIYDPGVGWHTISCLHRRPLETVYIDIGEKDKIIKDVLTFIGEEEDYIKYGIPYKRCYLLQGTAGSGKTSLIFAIASLIGKDIGIFNFSAEITDAAFIAAISQLDQEKILVFEDLDSLFVDRNSIGNTHISFSALINVLDGICRKDKMITFLTTNHPEMLDPTLLRPGRIDYVLKFTFAVKKQIQQMYNTFRPNDIQGFDSFYKAVSGHRINMSLISKFLFDHRKNKTIMDDTSSTELAQLIMDHEAKDIIGII